MVPFNFRDITKGLEMSDVAASTVVIHLPFQLRSTLISMSDTAQDGRRVSRDCAERQA
jgi:hypothetical protein